MPTKIKSQKRKLENSASGWREYARMCFSSLWLYLFISDCTPFSFSSHNIISYAIDMFGFNLCDSMFEFACLL